MTTPTKFSITRRQTLSGIGVASTFALLPACTTAQPLPLPSIDDRTELVATNLLDSFAWNLMKHSPETATGLGVDTGDKASFRARLSGSTSAAQTALTESLAIDLGLARAFPKEALSPATRTSFEVVESAYSTALEGFALPYGSIPVGGWRNAPYAVIQNVGGYIDLPRFLDSDHPVNDEADAEAYISRLSEIPAYLGGELEQISAARDMGVVPPIFLLDKAISQMEASIKDAASGGSFVESIVRRTGDKNIAGDWEKRAKPIATGPVTEALKAQLEELKTQRGQADSNPGIWSQPKGDEWYAWALRASTTTNLTPDEIHELGLEELEQIHARMDPILRDIGYTDGSVGDRMTALGEDPRFKFAEGDPGRKEIMGFIQDRVDWIRKQMPRAFNTQVPANLEVRRLPLAEEPGAPTAYGGAGSKDGSIPGKMWINLRTTDLHRKYDVPTLVHHETIPGHVWQGEYANRLPLIRSILAFGSYSEGWALYAEELADELGAYADNATWRLGYLQDQAFRACRLVVDTGLHHKRWSRERAIRFFMEKNGNKRAQVENEVDRYCSWPGQACSYKIGHSEILRQRVRAISALGSAYDLKAFNDAVVLGGNVPLDVLGSNVGRYIDGASG